MPVYFLQEIGKPKGIIKIGKALDVRNRVIQIEAETGKQLTVLGIIDGYTEKEKELHTRFNRYKAPFRREWFKPAKAILSFITNETVPFFLIDPPRCLSTNKAGEQCQSYVVKGSTYCVKHHPDRIVAPTVALTFRIDDDLLARAKEKAGYVPFSVVARLLVEKWLKGEIRIDFN